MTSGNGLVDLHERFDGASALCGCAYCHEGEIHGWRQYMRAYRFYRALPRTRGTVEWKEVLKSCREVRDGWIGNVSGQRHFFLECPVCS